MARRTKEDAEQTRLAILESALKTFYEKGFSRTTFDEIAKRINLTKGAVYWHFRNKYDIIASLISQKMAEQEKYYPSSTPNDLVSLREAIKNRALNIEKDEEFRRFLFFMNYRMEWSEAVLDNVWPKISGMVKLSDQKLYNCLLHIKDNGCIKPETDIKSLQEILLCLWKGCLNHYIINRNRQINFTQTIMNGFDAIMAGIKMEKN